MVQDIDLVATNEKKNDKNSISSFLFSNRNINTHHLKVIVHFAANNLSDFIRRIASRAHGGAGIHAPAVRHAVLPHAGGQSAAYHACRFPQRVGR